MVVVLDCNILVMCLPSRSVYHDIYKALVGGLFQLAVTDEIVLEYEEIIQNKYSQRTAQALVSLLRELPNVVHAPEDRHFSVLQQIPFPKVNTLSIDGFFEVISK